MTNGRGAVESCREVRELLVAFLDDELPCERSHSIQEHLDACEGCRAFARMEHSFDTAMKARLARREAPASLFDRLAAGLERRSWLLGWRAPGLRAAAYVLAAALLVGVLAAPAVEIVAPGSLRGMIDSVGGTRRLTGVLVCIECEKQGLSLEQQRHCNKVGHHTGFKCPKTGLWNIVLNDASERVVSDPEMRGRQVLVEGRLLNDIRYVDPRAIILTSGT